MNKKQYLISTSNTTCNETRFSESGTLCQVCYLKCFQFTHLCLTLCDPTDCSTPGFPLHHQLPKLTQTHVSDAIEPSHPLSSASPPAFNLSQHQDLFHWVSSSHWVAKVNALFIRRLVPSDILTTPFSQASIENIPNFLLWNEVFSVGSTVRFHRVTPLSTGFLKYCHCRPRSFCRGKMAPRPHRPHHQRASSRGKASSWSVSNQEPASLGTPVNLASPGLWCSLPLHKHILAWITRCLRTILSIRLSPLSTGVVSYHHLIPHTIMVSGI